MLETMPTIPAPHHAKIQERVWKKASEEEVPEVATNLGELRAQADGCRRCPLWRDATQTVFGEGPENAKIVFVGEQPGDQEDLAGRPFVGPAGRVFDEVIEQAGIDREKLYVTNAVKHFKFVPRGKRRLHQKPNAGEVSACRWWIDNELKMIKPELVVAMGATAAQSLLGKAVPITRMRGQTVTREDGLKVFLTIHPSFILRIREGERRPSAPGSSRTCGGKLGLNDQDALRSLTLVGPARTGRPAENASTRRCASSRLGVPPARGCRGKVCKRAGMSCDPSIPSVSAAKAMLNFRS